MRILCVICVFVIFVCFVCVFIVFFYEIMFFVNFMLLGFPAERFKNYGGSLSMGILFCGSRIGALGCLPDQWG